MLKASRSNVRHSMGWIRSKDLLAGHVAATGLRHSRAPPSRVLIQALDRPEDCCPSCPAPCGPRRRSAAVLKASRSNVRHSMRLDPLEGPSRWPRCCDWSATQSRSAKQGAHSSFGPGRGLLSFLSRALRTATPERGCAESQPQQRPSFHALEPLDRPSAWPHGGDWSATQSRSAKQGCSFELWTRQRIVVLLVPRPVDRDAGARLC